jgi:hypothetical protein
VSATQQKAEPRFQRNEFYETLLRMRRDQPRRYKHSISAGMQRCVEIYEEQRELARESKVKPTAA